MKKAQAAMEFLMTYGWAILVVLIAIAALAYFGVLNPGRYLPSSCNMPPGLSCVDFKVDGGTNEITLVVRNGMGEDLNPFNISIAGDCNGVGLALDGLNDGEQERITVNCTGNITGTKFKEDITIGYTKESGISHVATGSISAQVQ